MENTNSNILIEQLSSNNYKKIHNTLISIRSSLLNGTIILSPTERITLITKLISYLEYSKLCSITLSILATCCLRNNFRREIIQHNGIDHLIKILNNSKDNEILNRVYRALGNISMTKHGADELLNFQIIEPIIKHLGQTDDVHFQQTLIRTLRILGGGSKQLKQIIRLNGISAIAQLLSSENNNVLKVCTKALASLTRTFSMECAVQIQYKLSTLIDLYYNTPKSSNVHQCALTIFENLTRFPKVAAVLIECKIIKIFIEESTSKQSTMREIRAAILSLCSCCKNSFLRMEIRKLGGLSIFIDILKNDMFLDIQTELLSSLVSLYCEIKDVNKLQEINLLPLCIKLLKSFVQQYKKDHCLVRKSMSVDMKDELNSKMQQKSNDIIFSLHSPTYQGLQLSDVSNPIVYQSFVSPVTSVANTSPDFYREWSPCSVASSSPLGPWSPGSSSDDPNMCWSPVISSHSSPHSSSSCSPGYNIPVELYDDLSDFEDNLESNKTESIVDNLISNMEAMRNPNPNKRLKISKIQSEIQSIASTSNIIDSSSTNVVPVVITSPSKSKNVNDFDVFTSPQTCTKRKYANSISNFSDSSSRKSSDGSPFQSDSDIKNEIFSNKFNFSNQLYETENSNTRIDCSILTLLAHLVLNLEKAPNSEIVEEINVGVLMDYVAQLPSPNQKASKILSSLMSNRYCFEKLIICNFIGHIENRMATPHNLDMCRRCSRLVGFKNRIMLMGRLVAESDFGVGTLIHILLTSHGTSQLNCLYAIGKLVLSKKLLYKIFFNSMGLKILLKHLNNENESHFKTAAQSLSLISCSIVGKYTHGSTNYISSLDCNLNCKFEDQDFNIKFLLDDGIIVPASREILSNSCDYFKAMLQGSFIEATQETISLPNIKSDAFLLILHLLHGCTENTCMYWNNVKINTLFKAVELAEQFLLLSIKNLVIDKIRTSLDLDYTCTAYEIAVVYSPLLLFIVFRFLLCSDINHDESYYKTLHKIIFRNIDYFCSSIEKFLEEPLTRNIGDLNTLAEQEAQNLKSELLTNL